MKSAAVYCDARVPASSMTSSNSKAASLSVLARTSVELFERSIAEIRPRPVPPQPKPWLPAASALASMPETSIRSPDAAPAPSSRRSGRAERRMRTVRRLFHADITAAVAFVSLAFLGLFFFIDFVDELRSVGERYTAARAAGYALLLAPGHLYELMPIAVLIGTIYALARLAQTSQYTILRTGGLGPGRALWLLTSLALVFGLFTFVVGDYLAPFSERVASQLDKRVLVCVTGEFGRTPKIEHSPSTGAGNASGPAGTVQPGRDHWPRGFSNIWAGGGIAPGRVIGATDRRGEDAVEQVCGPGDFLATIYHHLGIDYAHTLIKDFNGRPTPIVDQGKAIPELTP